MRDLGKQRTLAGKLSAIGPGARENCQKARSICDGLLCHMHGTLWPGAGLVSTGNVHRIAPLGPGKARPHSEEVFIYGQDR